jgi:hypothetical protein
MAATLRQRGEVYAPPRHDAYIVLLIISLVAMILGCALLYMDYSSYPETKPQTVSARTSPSPAAGGADGGGAGGGAAGQQGGAGAAGQQGGAPGKQ